MRQKRTPETEEQRRERLEKDARKRLDNAAAEDTAMDAMVKRNIELHGA